MFILHYIFNARINYALKEFASAFNNRPIRTEIQQDMLDLLQQTVNPLHESNVYGIDLYMQAISLLYN